MGDTHLPLKRQTVSKEKEIKQVTFITDKWKKTVSTSHYIIH